MVIMDGQNKLIAMSSSFFPIMNPFSKVVQQWNKFFVISCFVAIFIDPLFFFLLSVEKTNKCMLLNWSFGTAIVVVKSITDTIYLLNMLLQFRLAYVAPKSSELAGEIISESRKVTLHYLCGYFIFDLFVVLPLTQVLILVVIPKNAGSSAANYAIIMLCVTVLLQFIPRMFRIGRYCGFISESIWANFVINLLMFVLAGHIVGSCWYILGLQRVNKCLCDTCAGFNETLCSSLMNCGNWKNFDSLSQQLGQQWRGYSISSDCLDFSSGQFSYGIYQQAVLLTTKQSVIIRYLYSLFWGFQQLSTLAGNLVPSYLAWEILFTMAIVGLGLLLFTLLIGNMQNFLQSLGKRKLEMQLREREVEQWMSVHSLPEDLRKRVRQAERFNRTTSRGMNEEELLSNYMPDIERDIRRHFIKYMDKVIISLLDGPILDALCKNLKQKLYTRGSGLYRRGIRDEVVFIVRGKLESSGRAGHAVLLQEGDICGQELLIAYLDQHSSDHHKEGVKSTSQRSLFISTETIRCLTNVEAYSLQADDIDQVLSLFSHVLRTPRVQGMIRFMSPYWRMRAARVIQMAWQKWRKRHLRRNRTLHNAPFHTFSITR